VQFVLDHERNDRTLRFASLQSPTGQRTCAEHPELAHIDSVVWLEPSDAAHDERVYVRSAAALRVASYLGGVWRVLGALGRIIPGVIRDPIYDFIARHRHALDGDARACLLPTPEQRARFLDWESIANPSG
jgi:predicted DCC family thiol-disulfide oxidoreductase YuxK